MNIFITILWAVSLGLAIVTPMQDRDNSAYVAAMLTIAAIGAKGKV